MLLQYPTISGHYSTSPILSYRISHQVAYCLLGNNLTSSYSYGMLKNIQSYSSLNKLLSSSVSDKTLSGSSQHLSSGSLSVNGADSKTSTVQTDGIKMEQSAIRDKNNCRIVVENDHATHKDVHTSTNSSSGSIAPRHSQGSPKSPKYPIYKAPSLNLISSLYQAIITYVEKKKTSGFWFESYKLVQKHHLLKVHWRENRQITPVWDHWSQDLLYPNGHW